MVMYEGMTHELIEGIKEDHTKDLKTMTQTLVKQRD